MRTPLVRSFWLVGAAAAIGTTPAAAQSVACVQVAERGDRSVGCFITARQELGSLPGDTALYWHLDAFASRDAAERVRSNRGTVVESLGRIWLFTIGPKGWRPAGGTRIERVGPLALVGAPSYAAVYMEGVFRPGMRTAVHRHPGVEAWYTVEGEMCVETPEGKQVQRAGDRGLMVRGGLPMELTGTGTGMRRSLVLILQDAAKPRQTLAPDWRPTGLCPR
jgi:hypothetical protein